ncbi:putative quinol monooxygenase [Pseudonocardia sp. KRD291]|uniref:putative quinol monooxygenase n=1 Tax=Pseudonocardia sp. KRD291 TaxID=2792007 RepID=UPI001C4A4CBD|nr:putative quinol monooxygenase [Pseudonocardia sp. KRD291]MBW0106014.1 antibiotic biosynthesis monooxygenase [Pseudonocardia sp. KRD291]
MATPTDDNRDLLTVVARMRAKPGKEADLRRELEALIEPTRAEKGCVNYDLNQGVDDEAVFYFYENWVSEDALNEHLQTAPLQRFVGIAGDLLEGDLQIQKLRRIA